MTVDTMYILPPPLSSRPQSKGALRREARRQKAWRKWRETYPGEAKRPSGKGAFSAAIGRSYDSSAAYLAALDEAAVRELEASDDPFAKDFLKLYRILTGGLL